MQTVNAYCLGKNKKNIISTSFGELAQNGKIK